MEGTSSSEICLAKGKAFCPLNQVFLFLKCVTFFSENISCDIDECLLGIERKNENKLILYVRKGKFPDSKVVLNSSMGLSSKS